MDGTSLAQVRRFNRTVAQRIGAMDDRFLARERPLAEARVLWEIGPEGCEPRALRARLGLDAGRLRGLLRGLEADGLVTIGPTVELTAAGRAERAVLDERSDELARSFLAPLDAQRRERLLGAMADVERLLTAAMVEVRAVDPAHPDARRCLEAYFAELNRRADRPFDPSRGVTAQPHELRPPAGVMLVAYLRSEPVACGAVKHHGDAPSEIKRMWVSPDARGLGLGRRLLVELEDRARRHGARAVRLDTNRALTEAIALYRSAGYAEVAPHSDEPFADHWFEKAL